MRSALVRITGAGRANGATVAALALIAWSLSELFALELRASPALTCAFALGLTLPLLAIRRWPLCVATFVCALYLVQTAMSAYPLGSVAAVLALAYALFGASAFGPATGLRGWGGVALAAGFALTFVILVLLEVGRFAFSPLNLGMYTAGILVAAAVPGFALRDRRGQVGALRRSVEVLEARVGEHVEVAVEAERDGLDRSLARVATGLVREVRVLTATASRSSGEDLAAVGHRISALAASATDELRGMLGMLRGTPAAPMIPGPPLIVERRFRVPLPARDLAGRLAPWLLLAVFGVIDQAELPELPYTAAFWGTPFTVEIPHVAGPTGMILAVLMPLPLVWRREAPLLVVTLVTAMMVARTVNGDLSSLTMVQTFTGCAVAYVAGAWSRSLPEAVCGLLVAVVGSLASWYLEAASWTVAQYAYMAVACVAIWAAGRAVAGQVQAARGLRREADILEFRRRCLTEVAIAAERRRVARELHDVVGHGLSLIAVQAGVAEAVGRRDPAAARAALAHVDEAARATLSELTSLRLLLADPDPAKRPGRWSARSVRRLVEDAVAAGQPVRARLDSRLDRVPPATAAAVVRIVQESLTNARKHATGETTDVDVAVREGEVAITVRSGGGAGEVGGDGASQSYGLEGMAVRAAEIGGTLRAGPQLDGWAVEARLPL
ncbi:MAG: hypothetical protein JHC95_09975 [Solirubrobacteraceae bacterium]|nr:hypothetical protein [Solirubrobacteraceae bacterium]